MNLFRDCLATRLPQHGIEVQTITPRPLFSRLAKFQHAFSKYVVFAPRLLRAARQADLLHICDPANASYLGLIPLPLPTVVTCHDLHGLQPLFDEDSDFRPGRLHRAWQRVILRGLERADRLPCVSEHTLAAARRFIRSSDSKASLIFNSIYQDLPRLDPDLRRALIDEIGPQVRGRPFILHVGSRASRKNRPAVLHTLQRLRRDFDVTGIFAGDGPDDSLKQLEVELGLQGHIAWCVRPALDLLSALFQEAHALLFPSTAEGFGLPVAEALTVHCPVVCSDLPTHREILCGAGLTARPHDHEAFARHLLSLRDPAVRAALQQRGAERGEFLAPDRMVADYAALYQGMLRATPATARR